MSSLTYIPTGISQALSQNSFILIAEKILDKSIPMLDAPTGAKNVIVSSAKKHRFASCGSYETVGIRLDKWLESNLCA